MSETFLHAMRLARQDFWRLRKNRPGPLWAHLLLTATLSLGIGVALLLVAGGLGGRLANGSWWLRNGPPTIFIAFCIGMFSWSVWRSVEHFGSQRLLDWANGKPGLGVGLFYMLISAGSCLAGWLLSVLILRYGFGLQVLKSLPSSGAAWLSFAGMAAVISLIWGLYAWQQWHEEQLKRQAQEAQLKLLQAQIEPHYLFNTLANVRSLIDVEPTAAAELLDAFTEHLRASLTSMRAELVPLDTELDMIGHYLRLMQLRMGERLRFHIEADAQARQVLLPPLLLQPLVENAIHHGLEAQVEPGSVSVQAQRIDGVLRIRVQDDGVGLDAPKTRKGNGVATKNIGERLLARYGERAMLRVLPAEPKGTLAEITIPLNA